MVAVGLDGWRFDPGMKQVYQPVILSHSSCVTLGCRRVDPLGRGQLGRLRVAKTLPDCRATPGTYRQLLAQTLKKAKDVHCTWPPENAIGTVGFTLLSMWGKPVGRNDPQSVAGKLHQKTCLSL